MAKKGGIQQLQAEIYTDDDLDAFLGREGVLGKLKKSFIAKFFLIL